MIVDAGGYYEFTLNPEDEKRLTAYRSANGVHCNSSALAQIILDVLYPEQVTTEDDEA